MTMIYPIKQGKTNPLLITRK